MKKILIAILISSITSACAEKTTFDVVNPNGFTEEQIRSDWELPPTPDENDPDYNTIKGVVYIGEITNDQAARSDWIITNAIATYPDKREFDLLNKGAVNSNQMIEAYEAGDEARLKELFEEYIWTLTCHGYYYYDDDKNLGLINSLAKNTADREKYKEDILYKIEDLLTDYISFPTDEEAEEKCPDFIAQ